MQQRLPCKGHEHLLRQIQLEPMTKNAGTKKRKDVQDTFLTEYSNEMHFLQQKCASHEYALSSDEPLA